jgi:hypothetical protein
MDPLLDLLLQTILNTDYGSIIDITDPGSSNTLSNAVIEPDFSFFSRQFSGYTGSITTVHR